jgi:hypothetical protein
LYIPGAPQGNDEDKIKFLSAMAMKYDCSLAKTMVFEHSHEIAKLASKKENAAFCHVSKKGLF